MMKRAGLIVAILVWAFVPSSASADMWTQQEDAAPVIYDVVALANHFWDSKGVPQCPDIDAWTAPTLDPTDNWGDVILGRGGNCNIWLTDYAANLVIDPDTWDTVVYGCAIIVHEVGHARGLSHAPHGIMMATLDLGHLGSWVPPACVRWGRIQMREALRGDGVPERLIKRKLARGYNPRAFVRR